MGVMSCSRNGCNNIMCHRYSVEYGYICNECFEELVHSNLNATDFMYTKKTNDSDRYDYYDREFPNTRNEEIE